MTIDINESKALLYTAVLSDVMDDLGLMNQAMRPFVRPLDDGLVMMGRARMMKMDVPVDCAEAHVIATAHLAAIRERIARLKRLEKELTRIEAACHADHVGDCNIIQVLADHGLCESEH